MSVKNQASTVPWNRFGKTGQRVPPISIGCAPIGDMPEAFGYGVSEEDALATIRAALDSPIPYIDTAALYGNGESERRVGLVLRERGGLPAGAVLQTKAGRDPVSNDFSGDTVRRRFERSLQLLGVDRIEFVYLHDPEHTTFDQATAPGGPVAVLQDLKEQGVIGYLGVAGGPIALEMRYVETGIFDAVITHNRYTLLNRSAEPLIQYAAEKGLAVLNAAPYGSGLLAKGPAAYPRYAYQQASPELIDRVNQYAAIGARHGVPLPAIALQFSTRDPRITNTIVGMSKPERIEQTLDLYQHPIPTELWAEIGAVDYATDDPEIGRFQRAEE
ncbi:MAG: aldo/keto reductase [Chloroflexota bacterium]|nr:aldo/keto reductase [Chloroflexota bacterium]